MTKYHKIATTSELSTHGDHVIQEVRGQEIAVFNIDGEYHAIANYCIHQAGPLCERGELTGYVGEDQDGEWTWENEGQTVTCPWHGWKFDVSTGTNVNDQRYRVPTYDVAVEDGEVFIER